MITLKDCIGLDLGTSKFRFYKKGKPVSEIPSKIIREDKSYGPIMREGKIACFIEAETLVRQELKKINPPVLGIFHKSIKCFISVPSDMNKTALRAFLDLAEHAGSRQTYFIDRQPHYCTRIRDRYPEQCIHYR